MENLTALIRDIPDFPEPGIVFKDITPVLADGRTFAALIDALAEPFLDIGVDKVAGIEARGFTLATPVAERLGAGFIPIRKPGKLPYETVREDYSLEYGTDSLEMHTDAVLPGDRVILVDDLLATGGTMQACIRLAEQAKAEIVGCAHVIELDGLKGRDKLAPYEAFSLIHYPGA